MIEIFVAEKKHLPIIVEFQLEMARETENKILDRDTVYKGVEHVFDYPDTGRYYLAKRQGEVIASLLVLFEWSDWRNGNVLWIHSVFVQPKFRGQGVYTQLYRFLQSEVNHNSQLVGIRLYVDKTNVAAQRVYQKLGMNARQYDLYEWMPDH